MKKRIVIFLAAAMAAMCAQADTWTDPDTGYTWTYQIIGGTAAELCRGMNGTTISPNPTGTLAIPAMLGGKPVTSIANNAFYNCSGLESVTIPDSVTSIGGNAFHSCSKLTSVEIPDNVTSIGDGAFYGCGNLKSVVIPDSVTSIGWSVLFYNCSGLMNVKIGGGVTSVGERAFSSCSSLKNVIIGKGVTSIANYAFYDCDGLESVTIPDSVTSIGDCAFYGCANLKNAVIPDGVTSIGQGTFYNCSGLTSVTIGKGVTSIGWVAFYNCSSLTNMTIPASVTSIDSAAFSYCSSLKSVTVSQYDCSCQLKSVFPDFYQSVVNVFISDGVTRIGDYVFSGCTGLENVTIPDSVTSIGKWAFDGCVSLNYDLNTVPGVKLVDGWAVDCADTLSGTLDLASVRGMGDGAFDGCNHVTSVVLPQCVCSLQLKFVFPLSYQSIVRVVISDGVTRIGDAAFSNCTGLENVTIPDSVTSIGSRAFDGCVNLNYDRDTIPGVKLVDGWAVDCVDTLSGSLDLTSVRGIGENAFDGCSGVTSVKLPQCACSRPLRSIFPLSYQSISSVFVADGVTRICDYAFDGCSALENVWLPSSVTSIGVNAFRGCPASVELPLSFFETAVDWGLEDLSPAIRNTLTYDADGFMIYNNWILDYWNRSASAVTIPEGIVGIGRGAFAEMYDLETVTMPESLRSIASGAFEGCTYIQNLQFKSGLRHVGPVAFRDCSSLLGASFADGLENIGTNAFEGCWQMRSVRLPYTVTNIGERAFSGCGSITGVTVPTHVKTMQELFPSYSKIETAEVAEGETKVMDDMFADCVSLRGGATQTDMSMIPNTVTTIGARAFKNCTSLTAFVVPDSVVEMGESVFQGCTALWNVTLSRGLSTIPDYAFYGCDMLETMIVPENVTYLGNRFFSGRTDPIQGPQIENALYYLCDNAPDCHPDAYSAIAGNMTTYVLQNSRSWDGRAGSRVLPQSWNGYAITYWTPNRFDVTFDANGGRFDAMGGSTWSEQQITDTPYALPSTEPTRPGWAFEGWWTEQMGGAEVRYTTLVTATRTHTIYAHWRSLGEGMTVTFNSNDGTVVVPGTQNYVPGQTFGQFPVPTRRGYTFQGWWTEAASGIRMTEATAVPAADMELFAHWSPITYYVRFHANGGLGTMSDQAFTFDVRGALETHTFTREGFAFTGWATTPSGQVRYAENASVVNLEEVDGEIVDLYAVWSGVGYSVRFDSNGGTGIMENQTIAVGETQNLWPCVFARAGYTFAGWAVSPTDAEAKKVTYLDGQAVKNLATSNGAVVPIYAVWVTGSQTVRITFDANGGSVAPNDYWDCVVGTAVEAFPTPTRPGFTFAGWWTAMTGGTQVSSIAYVASAQTFYAHWTPNGGVDPGDGSCTVTFNANGGSVAETSRKVASGSSVGTLPTPTRTGYMFTGWFTAANDGTQVTATTKVTAVVTFYAHWTANGGGSGGGTGGGSEGGTGGGSGGGTGGGGTGGGSGGPGTIVVSAPVPLSVEAGNVLHMTFSRVGGNQGAIAVKAKTQTSTALMGVNGAADFDYVKTVMTWADGDSSARTIDVPTYVQPWEGTKMLRVKLSTLATGAYAGNLVPKLDQAKIYVDLENPSKFGTVSVEPLNAQPVAGQTLRLVFRRTGGNDWPIAVKYKVQTSTAIAGVDFEYMKDVIVWGDGEDSVQYVDVPTYRSGAGKQLRVKLSTLTQGAYEGCVTPHVKNAKVYVTLR